MHEVNSRFPALLVVSTALRILGVVLGLAGAYLFLYEGIIEPNQLGHRFTSQDTLQLLSGGLLLVLSLLVYAFAEVLVAISAIELNTRKFSRTDG